MTCAYAITRYYGDPPGADTNDYVLYSTTSALGQAIQQGDPGIHRVRVDIACDNDGTINFFKSRDRGVTWRLVEASAETASATATIKYEALMEPFYDYKLEWENGGAAQTYFEADVAILPYRVSADAGGVVPPEEEFIVDDVGGGGDIIDDLGSGEEIVDA